MKLEPPLPLDTGKLEKRGTSLSSISILLIFILLATIAAWIVLWAGGVRRASTSAEEGKSPAVHESR